jgi:NAD(P)-dependent dehydrogenase (short-subunit alcohol dehydrogenase family)
VARPPQQAAAQVRELGRAAMTIKADLAEPGASDAADGCRARRVQPRMSTSDLGATGGSFALGRIGEPENTARVVAYLVSAEAGIVTGQIVCAQSGQHSPVRGFSST